MKKLAENPHEFEWEEDDSLRDPAHLARLEKEVMEGIMRSLNDPRPNITSEEMKVHIEEIMRRARLM